MQKTPVRFLGQEDPLEKGTAYPPIPSPVFWLEEFHGQRLLAGCIHGFTNSQTQLSDFHFTGVMNVILRFLGLSRNALLPLGSVSVYILETVRLLQRGPSILLSHQQYTMMFFCFCFCFFFFFHTLGNTWCLRFLFYFIFF